MIKTQTESLRGYGKRSAASAQTAVECRFGGEVETVLASCADAVVLTAEAGNGEVRYTGQVHFSIVYEDGEKHVCRAEKGVEFAAKAACDCVPADTVRTKLVTENLSVRREGASVYLSALLGTEIVVYGERSFDYLVDGDFICKRESLSVPTAYLCGGAADAEDEFETEFIGDLLFHTETVHLTEVGCETGNLVAEGEINLGILALKGENGLVSFERLVPFRVEIPCDEAEAGARAEAQVRVTDVSLHADADEEKGRCRISAELSLRADGCVYRETQIDAVTDAFSPTNALKLESGSICAESVGETVCLAEHISGKAALSGTVDFSDVFQAIALQRAEANLVKGETVKVEGVAMATLIVFGADGSHRSVEMSLPFSVPIQAEGEGEVSVLVCGTSARQRQEGEVDAEATLKLAFTPRAVRTVSAVTGAEEGEALPVCDSAISVYLPHAGDGLWELAKSLKKPPEEVEANNPDIEFPIKEGQRVVIYRKKSL